LGEQIRRRTLYQKVSHGANMDKIAKIVIKIYAPIDHASTPR
jgi:hypothetical protein